MRISVAQIIDVKYLKDPPEEHYRKRSRHGMALWGCPDALWKMVDNANAQRFKPVSNIGIRREDRPNAEAPFKTNPDLTVFTQEGLAIVVETKAGYRQNPNGDDRFAQMSIAQRSPRTSLSLNEWENIFKQTIQNRSRTTQPVLLEFRPSDKAA